MSDTPNPVHLAAKAVVAAMVRELDALQLSPSEKAVVLLAAADGQARAAGMSPEAFRKVADDVWRHCDAARPGRKSIPFSFDGDGLLRELGVEVKA